MGKLRLKSIDVTQAQNNSIERDYLYKDLFLDIEPSYSYNNKLNKKESLRDAQSLYDIEAIKNSIVNALLTSPGQKILNPEFGIDLRQYIFSPVNNQTTYSIRYDLEDKLPLFEPRIDLERIDVVANKDEQQYDIYLQINVPTLNVYGLSLKSVLNSNGYFIV